MPVIKHLDGICHVYIDDEADIAKAIRIADNAKTHRYGVCNAMETLLVNAKVAAQVLPELCKIYLNKGVELRGDDAARKLVTQMMRLLRKIGRPNISRYLKRARRSDLDEASPTSTRTVRNIPTASSPRTTARRCASCAKSIPAA